jgi:hypothetical protein
LPLRRIGMSRLDDAKDLIKANLEAEIDSIKEDATEAGIDMAADLAQAQVSIEEAMNGGDYEHVAKIITDHLPAVANREALEMREKRRESLKARGRSIIGGLLNLLTILVLVVVLMPGCAALKKGSVTTPALRGEMANVCEAAVELEALGCNMPAIPTVCDEDSPASLISQMRASSTVQASTMLPVLSPLCDQIVTCVEANESDLQPWEVRDWPEWCKTLEENARAAG